MANTVETALQNQIKNIEQSTGKTYAQWLALARKQGGKHGEIVKFLKEKHGLTHGNANRIALDALAAPAPTSASADVDPADAWFEGKKSALRPIYDAVAQAARGFGDDVEFSPKKTYMSLRRKKQFGSIGPATAARVDIGITLKGVKPTARLNADSTGMYTHRVAVTDIKEIDKELLGWLKRAYDEAG